MSCRACTTRERPTATAGLTLDPVRTDWLAAIAGLSGTSKALHLGTALVWLAARQRQPGVRLTRRALATWNLSRDAGYDGLRRLEAEHLIRVWRLPGRIPWVILMEPGQDRPLDLGEPARQAAEASEPTHSN